MTKTAGHLCVSKYLFPPEIKKAKQIIATVPNHEAAAQLAEQVVRPSIDRISKYFGLRMDPMFLGYSIYSVLTGAVKEPE